MDKISGIYVITNEINNKQYVGLSKNCLKRWYDHYSLKEKEIYWINKLNTYHNGYNETPGGETSGIKNIHLGEQHGMAKLKEADVIQCRKWYQEGKSSKEIWEQYYSDIINYDSFQGMWHGRSWKHVMPEVFENNPHPRQKISNEDIIAIRTKYF